MIKVNQTQRIEVSNSALLQLVVQVNRIRSLVYL